LSVSWLIPVRDGAAWLGDAVGSALAECDAHDQVVVVDDGSSDNPRQSVEDDSRILWLEQGPLGIAAALEYGRSHCIHPYIARLDSDDVALPGRIRAQVQALDADPSLAVVGGKAEIFCDEGAVPEGMARYVAWVNGLQDLHREILVESPLFHPGVLMRASALDHVGGYRGGDLPEDYDLWLRLDRAGFGLAAVSELVVRLRDRPGRLTRTDPRYRQAAFEQVKKEWLKTGPLSSARKVAVWGAGKTGKRWLRWLKAEGHDVHAVLDVHCRTERQGVPVLAPERLVDLEVDCLFVAVGARGARASIRSQIQTLRADWAEGSDWWALT